MMHTFAHVFEMAENIVFHFDSVSISWNKSCD